MRLLEQMCSAVPPPDQRTLAEVRARVLDRAASGGAPEPGRPARFRLITWRRLTITGVVAAAAACAVVLALTGPAAPPAGTARAGARLDAAIVLRRAARAALAEPEPRDGQFIYTEVHTVKAPGYGFPLAPNDYLVQSWASVDGAQPGSARMIPCIGHTSSCLVEGGPGRGSPVHVTYAWVRTLPTDPGALLSYLETHNGCDLPPPFAAQHASRYAAAYSEIFAILRELFVLPPRFGSALFDAAAMIPGVTVLPRVTDAAGGTGIAVAMTLRQMSFLPPLRVELIFDPHTYRFVGLQEVSVRGRGAGTVEVADRLVSASVVAAEPHDYMMAGSHAIEGVEAPVCFS
jgi:hypothetical protein